MPKNREGEIYIMLKEQLFNMDIQLFAEGELDPVREIFEQDSVIAEPGTVPVEQQTIPTEEGQTPQETIEGGQAGGEVTETAEGAEVETPPVETPPVEQPPVEQAPQVQDPLSNPVVQQLVQQNQLLQQTLQQQQQQMQEFMQKQMTQIPQQPQIQKTPEEIEAENQALVDELLQNPTEVLNRYVQQAINPLQQEIQGYKQKELLANAKQYFANMKDPQTGELLHPDYDSVAQRVDQIIQERPFLIQDIDKSVKGLKGAYDIAMAEKIRNTPPPQPNIQEAIKDPNVLQQLTSNPEIMKMIMAKAAQAQQQVQQQVPPMAPSSGTANAAPYIPNKPESWKDASNVLREKIKQGSI